MGSNFESAPIMRALNITKNLMVRFYNMNSDDSWNMKLKYNKFLCIWIKEIIFGNFLPCMHKNLLNVGLQCACKHTSKTS